MAPYLTEQKVLFIIIFYFSVNHCVAVERQYRRHFSVPVAPWIDTICRIIKLFEETESLRDKHAAPT
jgi:hypothetical protein